MTGARATTPDEWLLEMFERRYAATGGGSAIRHFSLPLFALKDDHEQHFGTCQLCNPITLEKETST